MFNRTQAYGHKVRRLMQCLTHDTTAATTGGTGRSVDTVVRTLCMPLYEHVPWADIPSSRISTCALEHDGLAYFPDNWNAAQLSAFVCQRPDWPWLVSAFTCLWKEYADLEPEALPILWKLCTSPPGASTPCELRVAADAFYHQHGYSPHPCMLLRDHVRVAATKRLSDADVAPEKKQATKSRAAAEATWQQRWWQQH